LSVSTGSSRKPGVKKIGIVVGKKLEKQGEVITVSNDNDYNYDPKNYKVPADVSKGPRIQEPAKQIEINSMARVTSTGSTAVTATQVGDVEPIWQYSREEGKIVCAFFSTYTISNTTEKPILITNIVTEYQDKTGKWVETTCYLSTKNGSYSYNWDGESVLRRLPLKELDITATSVSHAITLPGKLVNPNRWAHHSLPQPLKLRTTFELNNKEKVVVVFQQVNDLSNLLTRARYEKNSQRKVLYWVQADDTESETRYVAKVLVPTESPTEAIGIAVEEMEYTVGKQHLTEWAFKAKEENYLVEDMSTKIIKLFALVDLKNRLVYGLKFELKTDTSSTTGHFLLPKLT